MKRVGGALTQAGRWGEGCVLTPQECTYLFTHNDLAAIVCSALPEEAMASAFSFKADRPRLTETLNDRLQELDVLAKVLDAAVFGRVHGDCYLYMVTSDRAESEREPLNLERVKQIRFLRKIERERITPFTFYMDPMDEKHGEPETYMVTFARSAGIEIHETRLLKFPGARTAEREREINNWFDHSVLQRIAAVLFDFDVTWAAAARLVTQSIQGKYKLKDLASMLAAPGAEGRETLSKRVGMIDEVRGMFNALILDADAEDFTYEVANFSALPELLDRFANRLAAAAGGIPVTKLFGVSPAGMNATGEADQKNWLRLMDVYRRDKIAPAVRRLLDVLLAEQGKPSDAAEIVWPSLDEPTALELAQLANQVAQTDVLYITNQVLSPAQVAEARFGESGGLEIEPKVTPEELADMQTTMDETEAEPATAPTPATEPATDPEA